MHRSEEKTSISHTKPETRKILINQDVFENYYLMQHGDIAWLENKKTRAKVAFDDLPDIEKQRYHRYSWSHFQSSDRFRLSKKPTPGFGSAAVLLELVKHLQENNAVSKNAFIFKELLRKKPDGWVQAFAALNSESLDQLLKAMEADYIFLTPGNMYHDALNNLIEDAKNSKEENLANQLNAARAYAEKQFAEFRARESKSAELSPARQQISYKELLERSTTATKEDEYIFDIFLKHYHPACNRDNLSAAQAFKLENINPYTLIGSSHRYRLGEKEKISRNSVILDGGGDLNVAEVANLEDNLQDLASLYKQIPFLEYSILCKEINKDYSLYLATLLRQHDELKKLISSEEYRIEKAYGKKSQDSDKEVKRTSPLYINEEYSSGRTLLHAAALIGDCEAIEILIEAGISINQGSPPALHLAARNGHLDAVKLLVERGADLHARGGHREETPLHLAAQQRHIAVIEYLCQQGANIEAVNLSNETPLHNAVGCVKTLSYFINRGADLETKSNWSTALGDACNIFHMPSVQLLLKHGANPNVQAGGTPILTRVLEMRLSKIPNRLELVKTLIEHKADFNKSTTHMFYPTALFAAVTSDEVVIVKVLLEAGADPTIGRAHWKNNLLEACKSKEMQDLIEGSVDQKTVQLWRAEIEEAAKSRIVFWKPKSETSVPDVAADPDKGSTLENRRR